MARAIHTTLKDLTGQRFGELIVLKRHGSYIFHGRKLDALWLCRCSCGINRVLRTSVLRSGNTRSCGHLRSEMMRVIKTKHGYSRRSGIAAEYQIWKAMIKRCENPHNSNYKHYGGRGIKVCDKWRHDFLAFFANVGPRPSPHHSLDRIDNDGDYEPGNVRWATQTEQVNNSRRWA